MLKNKLFLNLLWVGLLILIPHPKVHGQQTIITVPSSEVLPAGDMIMKESNRFSPFEDRGFVNMTPSFIFGVGKGTEVSAGASTMLDGQTVVKGDFAAKKVFFIKDSTRLTVGARINPYFTGANTADTFVYSHFSHRIRKSRTSLTAGAYVASRKNYLPNKGGVLLGIEQVIIPNKLRLAVDWISSDESYGTMGVGLKYRPVPTLSLTTAVLLPNNNSEGVSFNMSVSKFISLKDFYNVKKGAL